ncbi:YjiH family protein [Lutispora thermophila]|uniref:Nucleoside recognition GATE domain-containing membrane protein YjiH n=1 Tax=Lutispora thermophila DSM 19022 TaxID=1122184 RepID=A0A1M6HE62_9FIRM|nr:YjiH family protein [Lutispora thermophila]SHJ20507.1 nucleoside recognition GATE domain-containing membrane protein YjiH [Lutispora thermophila DSM 19022]
MTLKTSVNTELQRKPDIMAKFILLNLLGIFMFFIPISIGGSKSIPIDHIVTFIRQIPHFGAIYAGIVIIIGAILPFIRKTWNKDVITTIFSVFKVLGVVVYFMAVFELGPERIQRSDMLPFVFDKVVIPVTMLVPVGAVFLAFLINYGLMEFIGVFMKPVMRPIWKTPGRSAVDAVASFVGSYSVALLITNRVYKEGYYTNKEACIIATGFSTVSATFMVVVAKTLGLMDKWNTYFWGTLVITFIVTALTARIYPLSKKSDGGYNGMEVIPEPIPEKGKLFLTALHEGLKACAAAPGVGKGIVTNFRDGVRLALSIGPTLMSIGFFGLVLAEYTPLFDVIGYIFMPFTMLLGFGTEAALLAKGCAISLAEMFLPASIVASASPAVQAVVAVVCVSEILFFSASIPCILSTDIDIDIKDLLIIWIERTVLSLILATPFVHLLVV